MCALDEPAPYRQGRGRHPLDAQHVESQEIARDVDDGVYCADFVEMDFVEFDPVDARLHDAQAMKRGDGAVFGSLRNRRFFEDFPNPAVGAAVMMRAVRMPLSVVMVVRFMGDVHPEFLSRNALFQNMFRRQRIPLYPQLRELGFKGREVEADVNQSAHEHVARSAREAVEIDRLHEAAVCLLMRCAWKAAPKPLSMFTTLRPEAHEFSMAKSAVSPPRFAP